MCRSFGPELVDKKKSLRLILAKVKLLLQLFAQFLCLLSCVETPTQKRAQPVLLKQKWAERDYFIV